MSKKLHILVVEDEFFLAEIIKARLEYHGYLVTLAENGQQACEELMNQAVDLVLMDVIMPIMDGIEATKKIRQDKKYEKLPIIILTAKARSQDKEESLAAGASDYLSKPFDMDELTQMIQKYV